MYQRLQKLRKERGISQWALAKQLGISQQTYSRYERGQRSLNIQAAVDLARFYGVSVDYLAGITDDPRPWWKDSPT